MPYGDRNSSRGWFTYVKLRETFTRILQSWMSIILCTQMSTKLLCTTATPSTSLPSCMWNFMRTNLSSCMLSTRSSTTTTRTTRNTWYLWTSRTPRTKRTTRTTWTSRISRTTWTTWTTRITTTPSFTLSKTMLYNLFTNLS